MSEIGTVLPKGSNKVLEKICGNVINRVAHRNKLDVAEQIFPYTATIHFLNKLGEYLGSHPDKTINVHDLLIYSVVNRPDSKGEKGGNIVPDIKAGPRFMRIFKEGFNEEDLETLATGGSDDKNFYPEPWNEDSEDELKSICEEVHQALMEDPYKTDVVLASVIYTLAAAFMDELARTLGENHNMVISLDTYHIFSTSEYKGEVLPHIECGETFKVSIKDDDITENEDE